jgi:hypothetical protein
MYTIAMVCPYSFGIVQLSVVAGTANGRGRSKAKPVTEVGTTRAALRRLLDHAARLGLRIDLGSMVNKALTSAERRICAAADREAEPKPPRGSRAGCRRAAPTGLVDAKGTANAADARHVAAKAHAASPFRREEPWPHARVVGRAGAQAPSTGASPQTPNPSGFQPDGDTPVRCLLALPPAGRRTLPWPAQDNRWNVSRHWPDFSC